MYKSYIVKLLYWVLTLLLLSSVGSHAYAGPYHLMNDMFSFMDYVNRLADQRLINKAIENQNLPVLKGITARSVHVYELHISRANQDLQYSLLALLNRLPESEVERAI